jgi:ferredoxin
VSDQWLVSVDRAICRCNAVCAAVAPNLFTVHDDAAQAVTTPIDDTALESAEEAQMLCPTGAITIERQAPAPAAEQ